MNKNNGIVSPFNIIQKSIMPIDNFALPQQPYYATMPGSNFGHTPLNVQSAGYNQQMVYNSGTVAALGLIQNGMANNLMVSPNVVVF